MLHSLCCNLLWSVVYCMRRTDVYWLAVQRYSGVIDQYFSLHATRINIPALNRQIYGRRVDDVDWPQPAPVDNVSSLNSTDVVPWPLFLPSTGECIFFSPKKTAVVKTVFVLFIKINCSHLLGLV